ncbi:MAG TPA: glycosyltransferase family 39 protein [Phycisphaerae bacterium]|nr:glycosyltransferase family 39 protein [Phycisphaerae bacterium]
MIAQTMPQARRNPWTTRIAIVLILAFVGQCLWAARSKSATYDEPYYLAAGYAYLTRGALEFNREHPPLMKYLLGLPLLLLDLRPLEDFPAWAGAVDDPESFLPGFLFENTASPDAILFAGRLVAVVLGTATAVLVWRWAAAIFGEWAGLAALAPCAFCPNLIAYSSLATLDIGLAFGVAAASFAFWRLWRRPSQSTTLVAGVALGCALLARFVAVGFLIALPAVLAAAEWSGRKRSNQTEDEKPVACKMRVAAIWMAVAVILAVLLVWAAYGWKGHGLGDYWRGFQLGVLERHQLISPEAAAFCFGRNSPTGPWWGIPAAFAVKTPIPILTLLGIGVILAVKHRGWLRPDSWFALVGIVLLLAATTLVPCMPCLRYVLPLYPLLYVLLGGAVAALWKNGRAARIGVVVLGCWLVIGTLLSGPHYLAYFNEAAGGRRGGIRCLTDSNLDWGQDLKGLAEYARAHDSPPVRMVYQPAYFVDAAARHYGLQWQPMRLSEIRDPLPGWYAISASILQQPEVVPGTGARFDWLGRFEPVEVIGGSIYVYRFD